MKATRPSDRERIGILSKGNDQLRHRIANLEELRTMDADVIRKKDAEIRELKSRLDFARRANATLGMALEACGKLGECVKQAAQAVDERNEASKLGEGLAVQALGNR